MKSNLASAQRLLFLLSMASMLATQSRVAGVVGMGEVSGLLFILVTIARGQRAWPARLPGMLLLMFVLGFVVGAAVNQLTLLSAQAAPRDLAAVAFSLLYAGCVLSFLQTQQAPVLALARGLSLAVLVQCLPLALMFTGAESNAWLTDSDLPGIPFLSRYVGLSDNPNQLGVLMCAFPFIALHAARNSSRLSDRFLIGCALVAGAAISVLIRSDTVFAAYVLCVSAASMLWINRFATSTAAIRFDAGRLAASLLLVLSAVGVFYVVADASIEKTGSRDANGRFERWQNAIRGIGESYLMGVGPGGQSGETQPFQGEEAHNLVLDITLQGGIITLATYVFLVIICANAALRSRQIYLVCAVLAILVEQLAHYTGRQPLAWVYLMLPLALQDWRRTRQAEAVRATDTRAMGASQTV